MFLFLFVNYKFSPGNIFVELLKIIMQPRAWGYQFLTRYHFDLGDLTVDEITPLQG